MKYKTNGYEVEGTPSEIREFINAETKTRSVRGPYTKKKTHQEWSKNDDKILLENWKQPDGQGDRSKYPHNKKVASMLGRTYDATYARYKVLAR